MKRDPVDDKPYSGDDPFDDRDDRKLPRTLSDHGAGGILVCDRTGRLVSADPILIRMMGYSREELIALSLFDLVTPADAPRLQSALEALPLSDPPFFPVEMDRKDRSRIAGTMQIVPLSDATFVVILQDPRSPSAVGLPSRRLAAIVESSEDAIIGKNLDGVILSWNKGAETIFGYTAEEMIGASIRRLIPPDLQKEEDRILETIRRGEKVAHLETQRLTKDHRRIDLWVSSSPIKDDTGRIVGASKIVRDITQMKARERDLARMTRLYAALSQINQAIVMEKTRSSLFQRICRVLIEQGGFQMAWIGWHDPVSHRLFPVAVWGDASGYLQKIAVYGDDRPEGHGPTGTSFRSGRPYICNNMKEDPKTLPWRAEIDRRGFHSSAVFPIWEDGCLVGTLSVYAGQTDFFHAEEIGLLEEAAGDLSFALDTLAGEERRRMAEAAAESEKQFSAMLMESMPGILYFYNDQGTFLRWNRNFEIVTGYSGDEISRMHPLEFIDAGDRPLIKERIGEVFTTGDSSVEAGLLSKSGQATPYFFTGRRVLYKGEHCLVGMGIDISERKKAETALQVLNENLEHEVANRTSAMQAAMVRAEAADKIKSAFLATMSHELRTPLNSIIGFTGILLEGLAGPLNDEQSKQLGMVQASARHLLELINDVLDISKIEANQLEIRPEPFDLRALLTRVIASVRPMAEKKGLLLSADFPTDLNDMTSDRRRVEQILLNLLNNAIKFTEEGRVSLTVRRVEDFQANPNDPARLAVRFQVEDTGIGIKASDLESLFQPFRQIESGLARQHEGTGLGLAICRRLCELLKGEITVKSAWAKGSVFTVTIPVLLEDSP